MALETFEGMSEYDVEEDESESEGKVCKSLEVDEDEIGDKAREKTEEKREDFSSTRRPVWESWKIATGEEDQAEPQPQENSTEKMKEEHFGSTDRRGWAKAWKIERDDNSPRFTAPSGREVTFWDASEPFVELFFDHDDAEDDPGKLEFLARELVRLLIEEELI